MARTHVALIAVVLSSLAAPGAAQGQVWVLAPSPGPGVDFTSPQGAIDAAANGDAILVKPGNYTGISGLVVSGKSLVITADTGGTVTFDAGMRIENLAPAQTVVLRGIDLEVFSMADAAGPGTLTLLHDQGSVWVEDAALSSSVLWPRSGLDAQQCAAVALQRCSIQGTNLTGVAAFGKAPDGLRAQSSSLALHDCTAVGGGAGFFSPGTLGSDGGHGAYVTDGFLFAGSSRFIGGNGGPAWPDTFAPCPAGGDGGDGLRVESPTAQAWSQVSQFLGGAGGTGSACPGLPGQPVNAPIGTYAPLPGGAHSFEASSPVREGQFLDLIFGGQPGELIFAAYSTQPGFAFVSAFGGVLQLGAPFSIATVAAMPPFATSLQAAIQIFELGAGVEFVRLFLQSAVLDPSTFAISLGGASSVLLLDAAF